MNRASVIILLGIITTLLVVYGLGAVYAEQAYSKTYKSGDNGHNIHEMCPMHENMEEYHDMMMYQEGNYTMNTSMRMNSC